MTPHLPTCNPQSAVGAAVGAAAARPLARRQGFTFIEVMFAVMILGFGVIMIAAMIPVAVRETQRTRDTNAGTAACETGFHEIETAYALLGPAYRAGFFAVPVGPPAPVPPAGEYLTAFPGTGGAVVTFPSYAWNYAFPAYTAWTADVEWSWLQFAQVLGSRIDSADPTLGYVPFYTRVQNQPPQLALLGVRARNAEALAVPGAAPQTPLFRGSFWGWPSTSAPEGFQLTDNVPLLVDVEFHFSPATRATGEPDFVVLSEPGSTSGFPLPAGTINLPADYDLRLQQAAVQGAALVLVNDYGEIRVLRLGKPDDEDPDELTWQLPPADTVRVRSDAGLSAWDGAEFNSPDFGAPPAGAVTVYRGYLVGRMLADPTRPWDEEDNPYAGPTQVVQVLDGRPLR